MYIASSELIKTDKRIKVCKVASSSTSDIGIAVGAAHDY